MKDFVLNNMQVKKLMFGTGVYSRLGELLCRELGVKTVLLITDNNLVKKPMTAELVKQLERAVTDVKLYCGIEFEPKETEVETAMHALSSEKFDAVIGFGGGSAMDFAKVMAALLYQGLTVHEIYGTDKVPQRKVKLILIPTTAGTGSEATVNALISGRENVKNAVVSTQLLPDIAILSPEFLHTLPETVLASTGMDALCHCMESYLSVNSNAISLAYSYQGTKLIIQNIEKAVFHADIEAKANMLLGSYLGGLALSIAGTTAVHALAYPLGKRHVAHGVANGLLLDKVLLHNMPYCTEALAQLAPIFGLSEAKNAMLEEGVIAGVKKLFELLPAPKGLTAVGVDAADINEMAREALFNERLLKNNPVPLSFDDAKKIYLKCV